MADVRRHVAQLRSDDVTEVVAAARALCMTALTGAGAQAVVTAGGLPQLVNVLEKHVAAAEMVITALSVVTAVVESTAGDVDGSAFVAALMAILRVHGGMEPVVQAVATAAFILSTTGVRSAAWASAFVAAGGAGLLVPAARALVESHVCITFTCKCVASLVAATSAAAVPGSLAFCIEALRAHSDCGETSDACALVVALARYGAADGLVSSGAIDLLVSALRRRQGSVAVATCTTMALRAITCSCTSHAALIDAGVPTAVVASIRRFPSHVPLLAEAICALASMMTRGTCSPAAAADAVPAVLAAWNTRKDDPSLATAAAGLLATAASLTSIADSVAAGGGLDLAAEGVRRHAHDWCAVSNSCTLMDALIGKVPAIDDRLAARIVPSLVAASKIQPVAALAGRICCIIGSLVLRLAHPGAACAADWNAPSSSLYSLPACSGLVQHCVSGGLVPLAVHHLTQHGSSAAGSPTCACALAALINQVAASKRGVVAIAAAATAGVAAVLRTLQHGCPGSRVFARAAIGHLAAHARLQHALVLSGAVALLVGDLTGAAAPPTVTHHLCVTALVRLAVDDQGRAAVQNAGGATKLCNVLHEGAAWMRTAAPRADVSTWLQVAAVVVDVLRALANMTRSQEATASMQRAGAVRDIVPLVRSTDVELVAAACAFVRGYAMGDGCELDVVAAGGATALVHALRTFSGDAVVVEHASGAVWNIASGGDDSCRQALVEAGALEALEAPHPTTGPVKTPTAAFAAMQTTLGAIIALA